MTYATQQLTRALQELTSSRQLAPAQPQKDVPRIIREENLRFSKGVEQFLEKKQDYARKTRHVSAGCY